jgi:ParB family chromosome partitioning protein
MAASAQRPRLGRGLTDLLDDAADIDAARNVEGFRTVPIDALRPSPNNPRRSFDDAELSELAASIGERGLVQPLVARAGEGEGYEIVVGERRWRAAQRAGLHQVPVIVRQLDDQEALELAIIENVQRADLNAIEEANGYRQLIEAFDHTQEELAQIVGKSRSHLANMLRLLKLPEGVQVLLRDGRLSAGHARPLIGRDDAERVAREIVRKGMSVRAVESLMQRGDRAGTGGAKKVLKDADTKAVETELNEALGLAVEIRSGRGESGELRIRYRSLDQLDEVRRRLLRN